MKSKISGCHVLFVVRLIDRLQKVTRKLFYMMNSLIFLNEESSRNCSYMSNLINLSALIIHKKK